MDNPLSDPAYPDHTDAQLAQASLGGDRKSLEQLILRHQPFVYNVALKMLMNPADAQDATQESSTCSARCSRSTTTWRAKSWTRVT